MYKLVALDLDGTLFNDKDNVSRRNMDAIELCHRNGIETVVATGRPPRFTFKKIPQKLLKEYCICYNGAQIFFDGNLIYEKRIDSKTLMQMIETLLDMDSNVQIVLESDNKVYSNFELSSQWGNMSYESIESVDYSRVCKILIINHKKIDYKRLFDLYGDQCNMIQTYNSELIEIMPKGVSKYEAIKWVADRENIATKEIIAFGDDLNDFEILDGVGFGVAMANGHQELKSIADHVTLSNLEDGVAVCLEEIIRNLS